MNAEACPFCAPESTRVFQVGALTLGIWDGFPVNPGHALLVPKRHVASWFDASDEERVELIAGVAVARREIERRYAPDGYNVGINIGRAAGQTVFHLHVHVIPRYAGDVAEPRGGVRHVVPAKADYLVRTAGEPAVIADRAASWEGYRALVGWPHERALIAGGEDELLPHLIAHLDAAEAADFAVAFVMRSGIELIREHLKDLLSRGGRLRFLTGDYLGVTDPEALRQLLDLREARPELVDLRIFEAGAGTFHLKSYLFRAGSSGDVALVGSSNLSRPALRDGFEWNYRTVTSRDQRGFAEVVAGFEHLFMHPRTRVLDAAWVDRYAKTRGELRSVPQREIAPVDEPIVPPPNPHSIQLRALAALEATRFAGNSAGLVVMATGLGKTWLAAFDSAQYRRVLFVAHRDEILRQAMDTFRRIRPEAHLGIYSGQEKTPDADVLLASVQTLGRERHLDSFAPTAFDYLVVDEFHHACASTYERLIAHFEPSFLLGLTATPERTDGGDLLALCQENLVFRCDLAEGIRERLLSPFHYFGVPDEVDYENIPWRNSRFEPEALTQAVATRSRAQNALEQYRARAGKRTLAFCCSTLHANFMRDFFREAGLRVAAVHSDPSTSDPRTASLDRLTAGDLDLVIAVDMFNEGVDLPDVDTVMMLRPTESRILWLQQFGRGLRIAPGKDHLRVIDYIGNHRTFLLKPQTLFNLGPGDAAIGEVLNLVQQGAAELPPGCEVTYDLKAIEILRALLRRGPDADVVRFYYEDFREREGVRPTASEMHHEGYSPRMLRKSYGSWLRFVKSMGDLGPLEAALIEGGSAAELLDSLETTEMTKSLKMLVLLAMTDAESFPGEIGIDELAAGVRKIARRTSALQQDFSVSLDDDVALRTYLERNPIDAWCGGKGTGGRSFFGYESQRFSTTFKVAPEQRIALTALVRELAEWRLAEYLDRTTAVRAEEGAESDGRSADVLEIGRSYMREEVPPLFGLSFNRYWQQGYVNQAGRTFLFVTLDKSGMPEEHRYGDQFLARDLLEWKSQNQHDRASKAGRAIQANETPVHLFVRKRRKVGSEAAAFIYCGELRFESWEGDKPITVRWRLKHPLAERVAQLFEIA